MQTKYKHIEFKQIPLVKFHGHPVWECVNIKHGDALGTVSFYDTWNQYVFSASDNTMIFSVSCMQDIIHFIGQLK